MHPSPVEFDRGVFLRSSRWPGSFGGSVGSSYLPFDESSSHRWAVGCAFVVVIMVGEIGEKSGVFGELAGWRGVTHLLR